MFILIIGDYYTGTTTILQIINTLSNCDVCGEHNILFNNIIPSYIQLKNLNEERWYKSFEEMCTKTKPAWYTNFNLSDVKIKYKELIYSIFNTNKKEIYGAKEMSVSKSYTVLDYMNYVQELNDIMGEDIYIILIKKKNKSQSIYDNIVTNNKNLKILLIDAEYWNETDYKSIKSIFKFLNKELEYDQDKITHIIKNPLSW